MNAANAVTCVRILLTPVFMALFLMPDDNLKLAAGIIFAVASFTDGIDGKIARKYNIVTKLGKFLDPLADKLLVIAAIVCMVQEGWISSVPAVIIIARELIITSFRIIAIGNGLEMAADILGKVKTFSQVAAVIIIIADRLYFGIPCLSVVMIWAATALTVISGANYIIKNRAQFS